MKVEQACEAMMWVGLTRLEGLVFVLAMEQLAEADGPAVLALGVLPGQVEECRRMAGGLRDGLVRAVEARAGLESRVLSLESGNGELNRS